MSITLSSALTGTDAGWSHVRESVKLALRARLNRSATRGWLQLLNSHPLFEELVRSHPRMLYKIYRPYLSGTLACAQRLALIEQHYRFVFSQGLGALVVRAARAPALLGAVDGKSGLPYQIVLRAVAPFEREGELVMQLMQDRDLVCTVAFSFFQQDGAMALGIGCVQGPQGEDGLQRIRDATRELHGLRPKNLLLRLLSQLGHELGCRQMRLVGNANRAVRTATRKGKVYADYDTLWQELDARPRADGDYDWQCEALAAPVMAEIASKKRSEARKRHETLVALIASVRAGLRAPRLDQIGAGGTAPGQAGTLAADHAGAEVDYLSALA